MAKQVSEAEARAKLDEANAALEAAKAADTEAGQPGLGSAQAVSRGQHHSVQTQELSALLKARASGIPDEG